MISYIPCKIAPIAAADRLIAFERNILMAGPAAAMQVVRADETGYPSAPQKSYRSLTATKGTLDKF